MILPDTKLELSIFIYRNIVNRVNSDTGNSFHGKVPDCINYENLYAKARDMEIVKGLEHKESCIIEIQPPINFYITLDGLLARTKNRTEVSKKFYCAELDYLYSQDENDDDIPFIIKSYINIVGFFDLLTSIADYVDEHPNKKDLIFLQKDKLIITSEYDVDSLIDINIEEFKNEFIDSEIHKEQKKTIIKAALFDLFSKNGIVKFSELLLNYSNFIEQLKNNYTLFVSEFSFQKVKDEIEKEKLEFITKINKVFSDIQNQLIALPIGLILAGGQMQPNAISKNFAILIGVFVFTGFMMCLIRNQRNTLSAIKKEIDLQHRNLIDKYTSISEKFNDSYNKLKKRIDKQRKLLNKIRITVILFSIIITLLFIIYFKYELSEKLVGFLWVKFLLLSNLSF